MLSCEHNLSNYLVAHPTCMVCCIACSMCVNRDVMNALDVVKSTHMVVYVTWTNYNINDKCQLLLISTYIFKTYLLLNAFNVSRMLDALFFIHYFLCTFIFLFNTFWLICFFLGYFFLIWFFFRFFFQSCKAPSFHDTSMYFHNFFTLLCPYHNYSCTFTTPAFCYKLVFETYKQTGWVHSTTLVQALFHSTILCELQLVHTSK